MVSVHQDHGYTRTSMSNGPQGSPKANIGGMGSLVPAAQFPGPFVCGHIVLRIVMCVM